MRAYKIKETDMGYIVYKIRIEEGESPMVLYRNGKQWSYKKEHSKTYITQDMAISALVISRRQEGIEDFWQG